MFGYIVGSVAHLVARLDASGMRYQAKMSEVLEYLHDKGASKSLARRVIRYYDYYLSRKSAFDEDVILEELSDTLRREVVLFINMDIIRRVPYFFHKDREFVTLLVSLLRPQFVYPGAFLYSEGETASEMFFLIKGQVEIVSAADTPDEHRYALLEPGSYFGELALLMGIRRSSSARALTHANLFVLTKDDLRSTVAYYPQLAEKMEESLRTTLDKLTKGSLKARKTEERKQARGIAANFVSTLMRDVQSKEMSALASHISRAKTTGGDPKDASRDPAPGGDDGGPVAHDGAAAAAAAKRPTSSESGNARGTSVVDEAAAEELGGRTRSAGDDEEIADVTGERGTVGNGVAGEEWKADIREYLVERVPSVLSNRGDNDAAGDDSTDRPDELVAVDDDSLPDPAPAAAAAPAAAPEPGAPKRAVPVRQRQRRMSVELSMVMRNVAQLPELPEETDSADKQASSDAKDDATPAAAVRSARVLASAASAAGKLQSDSATLRPRPDRSRSETSGAPSAHSSLLSPSLRPSERMSTTSLERSAKRASMPPSTRYGQQGLITPSERRRLEELVRNREGSGDTVTVPAATLASLLKERRGT